MRIRKGTFHNNGSSMLAIPSLNLIPRLLGSYLSIVNHDHFGMNTYHSHNKTSPISGLSSVKLPVQSWKRIKSIIKLFP
jgi:hypothetical protein